MNSVIQRLEDAGNFLEMKAHYIRNITCGLGRINDRTIGIVANQSRFLGGALLINLVGLPDYLSGLTREYSGIIR